MIPVIEATMLIAQASNIYRKQSRQSKKQWQDIGATRAGVDDDEHGRTSNIILENGDRQYCSGPSSCQLTTVSIAP